MITKIVLIFRAKGIKGVLRMIYFRMRGFFPFHTKYFSTFKSNLTDKIGIEIGGASAVFMKRGVFPVYPIASRIDNCNFKMDTVWEGSIEAGNTFQFDSKKTPGHQYITEATSLDFIPPETYDFVLSSHMLEHTANPILALTEWIRLLKEGGLLILLLPHKDGTFDHHRPITTMQHLISDFELGAGEDDLTHMPEILSLHDLELDPEAGDMADFKARCELNYKNRCFHHHVFDTHLAIELINFMGLLIKSVETIYPLHILIIAKKMNNLVDNSAFTCETALYRKKSPFLTDTLSTSKR